MQSEVTGALIGGRYRVRYALGSGGMGTVWSCVDETLHREVAVKEVGLLPGASVTDAARAYREARSSAALANPHVVTVYDMVEESGRLWMVMEQVPGRSLSELIKEQAPLDPALVAHIGAQVAEGLAATHAAGTVHRDVKPGNILVREDGVAKISDFGIARIQGDPTLTGSGDLTGTPSYLAPEVAQGGEPGPAADVWALGATLYAAVEGHPAYPTNANPVAVLHQIATTEPPPPQRAEFLTEPLARMLDRDPGSRWTMTDAAHVLQRLASEHRSNRTIPAVAPPAPAAAPPPAQDPEPTRSAAVATPESGPGPGSETGPESGPATERTPAPEPASPKPAAAAPAPRRRRRGGLPLVGIAVVVLLLAGAAIWLLDSQDSSSAGRDGSRSAASGGKQDSQSTSDESGSSSGSSSSSWDSSSMEQLVRDYYSRAPGGTDAAWRMLGPDEKAQGRDSYDSFWRGIESVDVQQAAADPSAHSVDVTLVYHRTDGSTSTEHKREGLVRRNGRLLLNSDQPS